MNVAHAEPITECRICSQDVPNIAEHVSNIHQMKVETYAQITGSSVLGEGALVGRRAPIATLDAIDTMRRDRVEIDVEEAFGVDYGFRVDKKTGEKTKNKPTVFGYRDRTPFVPEIDKGYVFPLEALKVLMMGIKYKDTILIQGETGAGKTSMVEQIAARLNYNVMKISLDGGVTREDLLGDWIIRNRDMQWMNGLLLLGMRMPGTIILLDEWDSLTADCGFVLHRPLQREDRSVVVLPKGGEVVKMHDDNVMIATANTLGQGDESGNYQGTKLQNFAQINRFSCTLQMKYMKTDDEVAMLKRKLPGIADDEAPRFVKAANQLRESFYNGTLSVPVSTRDVLNWGEKFLRLGDVFLSARIAFINRMTPEDGNAVEGALQRHFANAPTAAKP